MALLAGLVAAHGFGAVRDIVLQARYRTLTVIAVHLPVALLATIGGQVLRPRETRRPLGFPFRLRLAWAFRSHTRKGRSGSHPG